MKSPFSYSQLWQLAPLMIVLVSAAAAVGAYLQVLDSQFMSDDTAYITSNTKLQELPLAELWRLFAEPYNAMSEFLPLRELSYWVDMTLFGLDPTAFRLHNIVLFLLCLPLVYIVTLDVWRYFRPADAASATWAASAVTALFALHPTLVESAVWVSGRKYLLANLFAMLALWLAMRVRRKGGLSSLNAAAALAAFVAMMLSKTSYIAVAPVIAMLWVLFWLDIPVPARRRSLLLWPLAILLLAAALVLIFIANSTLDSSTATAPAYIGVEVITRTLAILGWLSRLAVSPESRHFFYPVFEDPYFPAMIAAGLAVLLSTAAAGVLLLRKRSLESFVLVVFLLLCMPYLQLVPYAAPSLVQDRFLSLAVWPVVLLVIALAWRLEPLPRAALLIVIALSWGLQTVERSRDWRSLEALTNADLRVYPGYYMPAMYKMIGHQLPQGLRRDAFEMASGISDPVFRDIMIGMIKADQAVYVDAVSTGNPSKAMDLLWQSGLELKNMPVQAKWNPVIHNVWNRRRTVLKSEWEYLIKQFPDDASVRYNAGLWMLDAHDEGAVANLRAAVESQRLPESVRGAALKNFGLALLYSGQIAEAEGPLLAALEQSPPDFRAHCLLSEVYKQTGRPEESARAAANCPSQGKE